MDQITIAIVNKVLDYSLLGGAVIVFGYGYWLAQKEIRALNAAVLELTKATTKVITENTAAITGAAAAQDRAAEAHRGLAETIKLMSMRGHNR
jgi:hypothetical protein